ncbi:MAG: hypothetical protein ACXWIU_10215 [Limisphaerales bacterium]
MDDSVAIAVLGAEMESPTVATLIENIVESVYPEPGATRERYVLAKSLHFLVFFAKKNPRMHHADSVQAMRIAMKKMMR